ncbi:MAG: hypothetical protein ABL973_20905 [Micropepsaceae bacterium]
MLGGKWIAAIAAAVSMVIVAASHAEDFHPVVQSAVAADSVTLESSARARFGWTEIAFRSDKPKAWDEIISPELRVSVKILSGLFEGRLELGALSDQFDRHETSSTNQIKAELQLGIRLGNWSILGEWKGRDTFSFEDHDFLVGLNVYDLRVRRRFVAPLFERLPAGQFQLAVAAGYSAAMPSVFQRNFAEAELEAVQPLGNGFAMMVAPKVELNDYVDFNGKDRTDTVLSIRLVPSYSFGSGMTVSVEGQATVALSTLDTKNGESWGVTPILRLQQSL